VGQNRKLKISEIYSKQNKSQNIETFFITQEGKFSFVSRKGFHFGLSSERSNHNKNVAFWPIPTKNSWKKDLIKKKNHSVLG
jgi:hypothetical protein